MKVLIIGTTDIIGGAAQVSWSIKEYLENNGHTVFTFVADKKSDDKNVKIIKRIWWRKFLGFLLGTESLISTNWILQTKEFKDCDIVHCHNLHGRFFNLETLYLMSLLKPVVWTLHDEWAITPHCACTMQSVEMKNGLFVCPSIDLPPRLLWNNTKRLAREKNIIYNKSRLNLVVPSYWLKDRVIKTALSKQSLSIIPNGIDTYLFEKTDKNLARKKLGLPLDKKIILSLADSIDINPWKGWNYTKEIINQFKKENNILFVSVGGSLNGSDDNLVYRSYVKNKKEISLYYSAADLLLFTSLAENFPLVILEAMCCGLPIVSFDVGGVKEVLVHKVNGFISRYKDLIDLKNGIYWCLGLSKEERDNLSNASYLKIKENYNLDNMLKNYYTLYNNLIKK